MKAILMLISVALSSSLLQAAQLPEQAATCLACHSAAASTASGAPQLAGQQAGYLQKQLQQFQNGQRGGAAGDMPGQQMAAMASVLSSDDITALAAYFSEQQPVAVNSGTADAALLDKGRRQYIGSCGACHGAKAEGNTAFNAPALNMLDAAYITRQLQHFKTGLRGTDKTDKPGRQMAVFSRNLSEQDIQAVAAYIGAGMP